MLRARQWLQIRFFSLHVLAQVCKEQCRNSWGGITSNSAPGSLRKWHCKKLTTCLCVPASFLSIRGKVPASALPQGGKQSTYPGALWTKPRTTASIQRSGTHSTNRQHILCQMQSDLVRSVRGGTKTLRISSKAEEKREKYISWAELLQWHSRSAADIKIFTHLIVMAQVESWGEGQKGHVFLRYEHITHVWDDKGASPPIRSAAEWPQKAESSLCCSLTHRKPSELPGQVEHSLCLPWTQTFPRICEMKETEQSKPPGMKQMEAYQDHHQHQPKAAHTPTRP